ncbi:EAL domain-containing protein [Solirubrobacter sp. CPCC 204708]|uniref:EAL domain-containing protein n=1 Tax=Solirubrobacter deserti TaxID=2282478 RepID=A0ABT4RC76_9ACTN|nr:EAL domain-containing protein [Solirubrobacter deserti]MBE2315501.1 EAL domain-containing protein [Solirubrobacter deserti]MDA0136140.1 EAL domain-containing protein [Solirubrobacter deserti]
MRLLGACAVTAVVAAFVPLAGGDGESSAAVPACLTVAIICAALMSHMLYASSKALDDRRMAWLAIGTTVAMLGLITSLVALPSVFPGGGPVDSGANSAAARYVIWHVALILAGVFALVGVQATLRNLLIFGGSGALLLAWAAVASSPLGNLADGDGLTATMRVLVAVIVLAQAGVAFAWWRRAGGALNWGELCVLVMMGLAALDAFAYVWATGVFEGSWWASLALRAGQFAIPAVGLLIGFIAVAEKLREFERELAQNLVAERERARAHEERVTLDAERRERIQARIRRMTNGFGLDVAFQPIVDLASGKVVGAEALARFKDADGTAIPTERCFLDAHAVDMGVELELAVIKLALECHERRLPEGRYLALNVSPAVLEQDELAFAIARHRTDRPLVVEITEHQPVEDYVALSAQLDRLRALGVRVAVDDVGSGFASFRHVTRVNPDILKLDRTLVCGIDDDPVRQSLASAIVAFAKDVGATVVSEGIENESELCCLRGLAVGCGQGFYLARPNLGTVDAEVPQLTAVA